VDYEEYAYAKAFYLHEVYNKTLDKFISYQTELEMVGCDKTVKLPENIQNNSFNLSKFHCPNLSKLNNSAAELGGTWDDDEIKYMRFEFNFCKDSEKKICKSAQNLDNLRKEAKDILITVMFPHIIFNTDDFINPFSTRFRGNYKPFRLNTQYYNTLFLGYQYLNQDSGILFESTEDKKEIGGLQLNTNSASLSGDESFYVLDVMLGDEFLYHTRKYMKFQDLIANVSGFMELVLFFLGFWYKIFNKFRLDAYLFNRLVFIKEDLGPGFSSDRRVILNEFNSSLYKHRKLNNFKEQQYVEEINGDTKKTCGQIEGLYKNKLNTEPSNGIGIELKSNFISETVRDNHNISLPLVNENSQLSKDFLGKSSLHKINEDQISKNLNLENKNKQANDLDKNTFKKLIEKLENKKNTVLFRFMDFCKYSLGILNKKNDDDNYNLYFKLEKYTEKIYNKFDIFYYLKSLKSLSYLKKLLFENEELYFINKISRKSYGIQMHKTSEDMDSNNSEPGKKEQIIDDSMFDKLAISTSINNKRFIDLILSIG